MAYRLGIDLGGTKLEAIAMDESGEIQHTRRTATPNDYPNLLTCINQLVVEMDKELDEVCPVGFGTPGAWIPQKQAMKNCNNTCMNGKPFLLDMQRILRRPVRIANDADCFALSEALGGAGRDYGCVFGVILGTGVGGGWVIDKKLLQGPNALVGEWGHNPLPNFRTDSYTVELESGMVNRRCYCGQENCVETFLSGPGLARTYEELFGTKLAAEDAPNAEHGGEVMELYAAMLARSLAYVINILDPDLIVLGGGVSNVSKLYDLLPDLIERYAFSTEGLSRIVPAEHGDSSGSRGAAWLF